MIKKDKETVDKINACDGMIFQTEKQLKEFGDKKLSDDKKNQLKKLLSELKTAHYESKDLDNAIDSSMEKINTAWTAKLLKKCIKLSRNLEIILMEVLTLKIILMMMLQM